MAEQVRSPKTKRALNSALDVVRPHFLSLGARISVLGVHQVELVIPRKIRNQDEHGKILPGVQISAAVEAYKLLWQRSAPEGAFQIDIQSVQARFLNSTPGDIRLRGEIEELSREKCWAELQKQKRSQHQMTFHLSDLQGQVVAEVDIESVLYLKEMLDWK